MTQKLGYRNAGKTSEEGINRIASRLISAAGVFRDTDMAVSATGTPDNKVNVATGDIAIGTNSPNASDADYYYHGWNTASQALTIGANASGNPRIDVVVAYVDLTVQDSTDSDNPGALVFKVVAGTAAATPAAPDDTAIQTSVGGSNPWLLLAQVAVANGFSTIINGNITDLRPVTSTVARLADSGMADYVGSGLLFSQSSGLTGQLTTGYCFIDGEIINKSYFKHLFAASKDTYIDLPKASKPTSLDDLVYTAVTNGDPSPALAANSIRLAKAVTDGSGITSVVASGQDTLGNLIRPTSSLGALTGQVNYGSLTSDAASTVRSRNLLINGNMDVWQRNTTGTPDDDSYTGADRWNFLTEGNASWTVARDTDAPNGSNFSMKFSNITQNNQAGIVQILEGKDIKQLANGDLAVSASFYAKTNGSEIANLRMAILSWAGTEDSVTSDVVGTWAQNGTTPTWAANWTAENTPSNLALTSSWQRFAIENIPIDSATVNNLALVIWVDDGTIAANDDFYVSQVQLNMGSKAASYCYSDYATELAKCQRYYLNLFDNINVLGISSVFVGTNTSETVVPTPTTMRTTPSAIITGLVTRYNTADFSWTAPAIVGLRQNGVEISSTTTGTVNGNSATLYGLPCTVKFDAEL